MDFDLPTIWLMVILFAPGGLWGMAARLVKGGAR